MRTLEMNQEIIVSRLMELHSIDVPQMLFSKYGTHLSFYNCVKNYCNPTNN